MRTRLKISEMEFKEYLLENYVDKEFKKVSDRDLWSTEEFFEYTGMYGINKFTGERQTVSTGTISYWKAKLGIKEKDVYRFHKKSIDSLYGGYKEWSRLNNKGYEITKPTYTTKFIKNRLIKYMGFSDSYKNKPLSFIQDVACATFQGLGLDSDEEMAKFFKMIKEEEV